MRIDEDDDIKAEIKAITALLPDYVLAPEVHVIEGGAYTGPGRREGAGKWQRGPRRGALLGLAVLCLCAALTQPSEGAGPTAEVGADVSPPVAAGAEQARPPWRRTEARAPCADYDPLKRPLFGDLHVHTGYSQDASTQGTTTTPAQAYGFAQGAPLVIGQPGAAQTLQLDRPLDFAAVTDHAEQLGEVQICSSEALDGRGSPVCRVYRSWPQAAFFLMNAKTSFLIEPDRFALCGPDGQGCLSAAEGPWADIRQSAELAYDRSEACAFTSFVGYEWTGSHRSTNLHRNVIFRNEAVPEVPLSTYEANSAEVLWRGLRQGCEAEVPGCEVLTIPHNSNLGGERMFSTLTEAGAPLDAATAAERAHFEPLVEVMQHKGDSECVNSPFSPDERCDFEKLPYHAFIGRWLPFVAQGPLEQGTARYALGEGLRVYELIQQNPFRYGMIASSDTHLGAAGLVSEVGYPGHGGAGRTQGSGPREGFADTLEYGPGGLAVVWAEENSRDAIFEALQRKEVYGTSGTRPEVRLFGGWGLEPGLCERQGWVAEAYATGVPMGASLPPRPAGVQGPTFVVSALMDPGTDAYPGSPLERVQVIKGWVQGGEVREAVFDVAVASGPTGTVDMNSCEPSGDGAPALCATWRDPDFDPDAGAYYYVRVLEAPTCRWSALACLAAEVDCDSPRDVPSAFKACCDTSVPRTLQERAWTSPIWYDDPSPAGQPPPAAGAAIKVAIP